MAPQAKNQMAWFIFHRKFKELTPWYLGTIDLVQEAVLRLVVLAGRVFWGGYLLGILLGARKAGLGRFA
jgi:hypothetical protein